MFSIRGQMSNGCNILSKKLHVWQSPYAWGGKSIVMWGLTVKLIDEWLVARMRLYPSEDDFFDCKYSWPSIFNGHLSLRDQNFRPFLGLVSIFLSLIFYGCHPFYCPWVIKPRKTRAFCTFFVAGGILSRPQTYLLISPFVPSTYRSHSVVGYVWTALSVAHLGQIKSYY